MGVNTALTALGAVQAMEIHQQQPASEITQLSCYIACCIKEA